MDRYPKGASGGGGGCRPCGIANAKVWHDAKKAGPDADKYQKRRNFTARLRNYGLTEDEFVAMMDRQDGLCAICQKRPAIHIDHSHETKIVRGILCFQCNLALGAVGDSIRLLERAIQYLIAAADRSREKQLQNNESNVLRESAA